MRIDWGENLVFGGLRVCEERCRVIGFRVSFRGRIWNVVVVMKIGFVERVRKISMQERGQHERLTFGWKKRWEEPETYNNVRYLNNYVI